MKTSQELHSSIKDLIAKINWYKTVPVKDLQHLELIEVKLKELLLELKSSVKME